MSSFKSNENIHKKEDGSYYVVSANKASSVTLLYNNPFYRLNVDDMYISLVVFSMAYLNHFLVKNEVPPRIEGVMNKQK